MRIALNPPACDSHLSIRCLHPSVQLLVENRDFEQAVRAAVATPIGSRSAVNDGVLLAYLRAFLELYV